MKTIELRQKSKQELQQLLKENREKVRQFRFDLISGKVKNIRLIRSIKKDIARIMTIMEEEKTLKQ